MAVRGLKPVVEIQFFDYIWPAMMQIRNELSMLRYRSGNHFSCPVVIRVPIGGYLRGGGPYHSQSGESIFAHCPGLRIAYPSNAADAAGLLRTAIRCDDPGAVSGAQASLSPDLQPRRVPRRRTTCCRSAAPTCVRDGTDVLVVTWGALVQRSLAGRPAGGERTASRQRCSTCGPLRRTTGTRSPAHVRRTNRVVIAHEDQLTCGFGAEIAARIAGELFDDLDAPVRRVAALDTPVAYAPDLEEAILPQTGRRPGGHPRDGAVLIRAASLSVSAPAVSRSVRRSTKAMSDLSGLKGASMVIDTGKDRVVLVPGIQGRWEYLAPAVDALAPSHRVITFSLRAEPSGPSAAWPISRPR